MRIAWLILILAPLRAQTIADFEKKITEFTLSNGLHFIVMERHEAPVVSFHLHVNSGSANDPSNASSTAHMFEHMIGKGTVSLGTTNWPEEEKALKEVEAAYDRLEEERAKGRRADKAQLERLEALLRKSIEKANSYVDQNAFTREIERNGGVGFNASTGTDVTNYFYSLPANRAELWFALQSEWTAKPVFREFYKERDVVREERRMRVESNPQGKLFIDALLTTAFTAHPYRNFVGWATDIENLRAKGSAEFHRVHYVPANMAIAIVGDVNPAEMKRLAEKYFGPIPPGPLPPRIVTVEPKQEGTKRVAVESPAQPFVAIGYHRPESDHPDDASIEVLNGVLSSGRTSILYKEQVRDKQSALAAQTFMFPDGRYPSLFIYFSVPNQGKSVDDLEKEWEEIVGKIQKDGVDAASVKRVKTNVRAGLLRALDSNSGLANILAESYMTKGDWRKLFTELEELEKVTPADVQRAAKTYLVPNNKTVAYTVQPKAEESK
jgi:predicted Zn-dependent peptidase